MSASEPQMYIYHLPFEERNKLCFLLDQQNKWEELGLKHMQFDENTIDNLRREVSPGNSPACELLTMWGYHNHTILELFILLYRMGLYQGMSVLKKFVDEKYYVLIKEDNLNKAMNRMQIQDSRVPKQNYDKNTVKCVSKALNLEYSNECNETLVQQSVPASATIQNNSQLHSPLLRIRKDLTKRLNECTAELAGGTPQISYEELETATDNWNISRILGTGGFATVFKGTWRFTQVAIKRLETKENTRKDMDKQIRQSVTELHCLNAYRHDNILPLYGYSIGGPHPCLLYQYMPGGSLDKRIRTKNEKEILEWPKRLNIAIGTARGLQFLHTTLQGNKPLIHCDIKSANILLDAMDQPKLGDFGLAQEGPARNYTHIKVSRVQGTIPYLPDEYLRSKQLSTKIDIYSFGVVLFELATGARTALCLKEHVVNYPSENILQLKDLRAPGYNNIFKELIRIGKLCVQKRAKDRPEMISVFLLLKKVGEGKSESRSQSVSE